MTAQPRRRTGAWTAALDVNVGIERKVVSVVPPVGNGTPQAAADGEAVNMFAGFKVAYTPATGTPQPLSGDLNVRTQFASGLAALAIATDPATVNSLVNVTGEPLAHPTNPTIRDEAVRVSQRIATLTPAQKRKLAGDLRLVRTGETLTDGEIERRIRLALAQAAEDPAAFASFRASFNRSVGDTPA